MLIPFPERIRTVDSRHVYPHLIVPPQFRKQVLSPNAPFAGIEKPGGRVNPGNFDDPESPPLEVGDPVPQGTVLGRKGPGDPEQPGFKPFGPRRRGRTVGGAGRTDGRKNSGFRARSSASTNCARRR